MINPISLEAEAYSDIYQLYNTFRAVLFGENDTVTNKYGEETTRQTLKGLRDEEIEKEIRLSPNNNEEELPEEVVVEDEEIIEEEPAEDNFKISVSATEVGLASDNIISGKAVNNEYSKEMDYDGDGTVTIEEKIKYYSEKYEQMDSENSEESLLDKNIQESKAKLSYNNKLSANYGTFTTNPISNIQIMA